MAITSAEEMKRKGFTPLEKAHPVRKLFSNGAKERSSLTGFTLVEIIIMAAIIIVISAIAIPNILRAKLSANDVVAQATLRAISTAIENYYAGNGNYPVDTTSLLNTTPPYINQDYFDEAHAGFIFTSNIASFLYTITATPVITGRTGTTTYMITTGGVFR